MRKIIAIGGEPATGKSTVVKKLIAQIPPWGKFEETEEVKLVPTLYTDEFKLHILGKYPEGEMFGGTDRYSMAVQPQAVKFIANTSSCNVLFEGDRLFNQSFLEYLADLNDVDLQIVIIEADKDTVEQRHLDRADTQNEIFLKGRKTKYENLRSNMMLMPYIKVFKNNNLDDMEKLVSHLSTELYT